MDKKLGPLKLWQWVAIGAAAGLIYYVYRARTGASNAATQVPTPTDTTAGPIDPTTGVPYAQELAGGGTGNNAPLTDTGGTNGATTATSDLTGNGSTTLTNELSDLASIESLMSGLTSIAPGADTPTPTTDSSGNQAVNLQGQFSTLFPAAWKLLQSAGRGNVAPKHNPAPKNNPGHATTKHPNGKHSTTSTSHKAGRTSPKPIAPPNHQRANPTKHPSKPKVPPGITVGHSNPPPAGFTWPPPGGHGTPL